MKKVIILGSYPDSIFARNTLSECVDKLSNHGYDLIIVSHFPIPEYIQSKVNYYLYDKKNPLLSYEETPSWNFSNNDFDVVINSQGHAPSVISNIINGVKLAESMGYDFFYYMEADNLMAPEDIVKLNSLQEIMVQSNRTLILFNPEKESDSYDTLLFGGIPEYFLDCVHPITMPSKISLERAFYIYLHQHERLGWIVQSSVKAYFNKSDINIISHEYIVEVIGTDSNDLYLWIQNHPSNSHPIFVVINAEPTITLMPDTWYLHKMTQDMHVTIHNNKMTTFKDFYLYDSDIFYKKGIITFKQNT